MLHRTGDHLCVSPFGGPGRPPGRGSARALLKTKGYHLEHNFGHGKEHLASLLATMNLLAFGPHTLLELTDESYRLIRAAVGPRRRFFQHIEALTTYPHFETWARLMDFMMRGLEIGPYAVQKS